MQGPTALSGRLSSRPCPVQPPTTPTQASRPARVVDTSRRRALGGRVTRPRLRGAELTQVAAVAEALEDSELSHAPDAGYQGVPQMWRQLAEAHGDALAVNDPHQSPPTKLTYRELASHVQRFAAGLSQLGLGPGERVALFSENSSRWLIADQGIMTVGAADAVRGSTSTSEEMGYIVSHSQSCGVVCQDQATLDRLLPALTQAPPGGNGASQAPLQRQLRFVVLLWGEASEAATSALDCPVLSFAEVLARAADCGFQPPPLAGDATATLVYTSGTTGAPKGVELTHANINYQRKNLDYYLQVSPGDKTLSLLPPWHIYERSAGYYIFSRGGTQVYTQIRKFKEDLAKWQPQHFVCVPLVLDSLYNKVQQQVQRGSRARRALAGLLLAASGAFVRARRVVDGVALEFARRPRPLRALLWACLVAALTYPLHRLGQALVYGKIRGAIGIQQTVVSGGGSLAAHLDDFYEVLGLPVLNGWGLSETSPVLACRRSLPYQNVRGTVGVAIPGTRVRAVDPETRREVPDGQQGLLLVKGPGVMKGYFNDAAATDKALAGGWFDTGDLGWRAPEGMAGSRMAGHIVLTGRAKDTVVLSSGENIEPQPLEDACCASPYISHLLVVGQDLRMLGALVAPNPEAFAELEAVRGPMGEEERKALLKAEVRACLAGRPAREQLKRLVLLPAPLSPEDGTLTRTLKPRRQAVFAKYGRQLEQLQALLR